MSSLGEVATHLPYDVLSRLVDGRIAPEETTVLCITGNGLKTTDALTGAYETVEPIPPKFAAFENYLQSTLEIPAEVA